MRKEEGYEKKCEEKRDRGKRKAHPICSNIELNDLARSGNLADSMQSLLAPTSSLISQSNPCTCRNFSWLIEARSAGFESTFSIIASIVSIGNCGLLSYIAVVAPVITSDAPCCATPI